MTIHHVALLTVSCDSHHLGAPFNGGLFDGICSRGNVQIGMHVTEAKFVLASAKPGEQLGDGN